MILKSLELQGFKSFPDKTKLTFDRGATVVVGPNGSGKSNISDAMKWVLGEISSKNLRGSKMEDVIFGGADTRRQMGFAEVSVTFENTGTERLATDYDEVTVTRRYYRAGESEYFINAKPVRLRDIHELFLNTGIGREGYSIIGQGKIAEIISRKSEERRNIFEEAAGIAKYKYKKEEAEKKLLTVEDNLTRVNDIVTELESRVGPLEKESEKARTYLALYEDKKKSDIALWLYDMQALKAQIKELSEAFKLSKNEYERAVEQLADMEARGERLYLLSQEHKAKAQEYADQVTELNSAALKLEGECSVLENEIAHIDERLNSNKDQSSEQSKVITETKERLKTANEQLEALLTQKKDAEAICEADRQAEADNDHALDEAYTHISELNDEIAEATRAAGDLKAALSALEASGSADKEKRAEIAESKEKYEDNIRQYEGRLAQAKKATADYQAKNAEFEEQAKAARAALSDIASKKQTLEEKQNAIFLDYTAKKNRIDALSRMEELLEGYSRSVRFVMSEYEHGKIPGAKLYGPLSKLITVQPRYATAVETALGANIQNIAVEDENSAKAAILHLKKNNAGRATFYPLTTMRASDFGFSLQAAERQKGYIGLAHTLVSYDKRFDTVIRSLLGRTLVTDNIDHATELARAYDYKVRIVTLDGQQINAGGSFTGGSVKHDSGMLTRSTEIETLRTECAALNDQITAIKADFAALDKDSRKYSDQLENLRVNMSMISTLCQAEITQEQVIESQLNNDREMLASLITEEEKLDASGDTYQEELEKLRSLIRENAEQEDALRAERTEAEEQREAFGKALAEAQRTLSRHTIRLTEVNKDIEAANEKIAQISQSITDMEARSLAMGEETKSLKEKRTEHTAAIAEKRKTAEDDRAKAAEAEGKRHEFAAMAADCDQKDAALRGEIKNQNHTNELLFQQYTKAETKHNDALKEEDKRVNTLWDEYELTYSAAAMLNYPPVTEDTRAKTAAAVSSLKSKIRALGPVNVSAIEEYTQVKERYDFMTAQVNDLTQSKTELADIIYQLEGEMRTRFSDAMREINHHFHIVFRELFGGGHAELILSEPDNILESGIEINVAPPGKIIKNLMLLSGGEQAFVAIALYFALLKVNPSPFCILDEIEAALDEVNVDKFADYLHRNSDKTQFIVITHRRGTMEIADRLYGVTMVEKGISTVLSISTEEVGNYVKNEN
ncbi:MAG: chromosome segregation protein SMC [Clostridia bacterium]|nr:chromosome segregation protein SMC [Clostridia bacterium]